MAIQPGLGAQGIAANWGSAPTLSAPSIGSMVAAILEDKRAREKQLRDAVSGTIGNVRGEMQSNAYLEAAKAAGIIPEGFEAGGLRGAQLGSTLAKQIEAQKLAALRGGLIEAQTQGALARAGKENTLAGYIKKYGHTPGARTSGGDGSGDPADADGPEIIERNGVQYQVIRTRNGIRYQRVPYQRPITPTREEVENTAPTLPGQTVYPDEPAAVPEPAPAETGEHLPTSKVQPTTGADKNVAQGYGTSATGMSADDVREAYRAGKMTRAEAAARLKQLGFSD